MDTFLISQIIGFIAGLLCSISFITKDDVKLKIGWGTGNILWGVHNLLLSNPATGITLFI